MDKSNIVPMVSAKSVDAYSERLAKYDQAEPSDIIDLIRMLAAGFPQGNKSAESISDMYKAYVGVVSELPIEPIQMAVMNFIRGHVEGQNSEFMPTSATFSKEARRIFFLWDHQRGKSNG